MVQILKSVFKNALRVFKSTFNYWPRGPKYLNIFSKMGWGCFKKRIEYQLSRTLDKAKKD